MRSRSLFLCLIVIAILMSATFLSFAQEEEVKLIFGSGSKPTSSYFPYHATCGQLFDAAPGVSVTTSIPGGSVAGAMEIIRGEIDITGGLALAAMYQMSNGLGKWKDNPMPNDLRVLGFVYTSNCPIVVCADSKINSIKDLNGKEYGLGYLGSSSQILFSSAFEALGYDVVPYRGSYRDAMADMKDGRLVGYSKTVPASRLDAGMIEVMVHTPLRIIGFSDEEVSKAKEKVPYLVFKKIPKNYYIEPGNPEMNELVIGMVWVCHKNLPENIAYEITKSYVEGWKEKLFDVFGPTMANSDPINSPVYISKVEGIFLHPGSLRYFKERGVEIPASVIPPEMR